MYALNCTTTAPCSNQSQLSFRFVPLQLTVVIKVSCHLKCSINKLIPVWIWNDSRPKVSKIKESKDIVLVGVTVHWQTSTYYITSITSLALHHDCNRLYLRCGRLPKWGTQIIAVYTCHFSTYTQLLPRCASYIYHRRTTISCDSCMYFDPPWLVTTKLFRLHQLSMWMVIESTFRTQNPPWWYILNGVWQRNSCV